MSLLRQRSANSRDARERRRIERGSATRSRRVRGSPLVEGLERRWLLAVTINEFPIPTPGAAPNAITAGPDGNLRFTESGANQIAMIDPTTHAVAGFPIPTPNSYPSAITVGPDGNLWTART
jgi:streptogramin lyase